MSCRQQTLEDTQMKDLTTVQETNKKLKAHIAHILLGAALFFAGFTMPFYAEPDQMKLAIFLTAVGLAWMIGNMFICGLDFLFRAIGTKMRIWWHHK